MKHEDFNHKDFKETLKYRIRAGFLKFIDYIENSTNSTDLVDNYVSNFISEDLKVQLQVVFYQFDYEKYKEKDDELILVTVNDKNNFYNSYKFGFVGKRKVNEKVD